MASRFPRKRQGQRLAEGPEPEGSTNYAREFATEARSVGSFAPRSSDDYFEQSLKRPRLRLDPRSDERLPAVRKHNDVAGLDVALRRPDEVLRATGQPSGPS